MAMTKQDYLTAGMRTAQDEDAGRIAAVAPFKRTSIAWQAVAFWQGYDDEAERLQHSTRLKEVKEDEYPDAIKMDKMPGNTKGWPGAAAEHARLLALAINDRKTPKARRVRLLCSLGRMQRRYQHLHEA